MDLTCLFFFFAIDRRVVVGDGDGGKTLTAKIAGLGDGRYWTIVTFGRSNTPTSFLQLVTAHCKELWPSRHLLFQQCPR